MGKSSRQTQEPTTNVHEPQEPQSAKSVGARAASITECLCQIYIDLTMNMNLNQARDHLHQLGLQKWLKKSRNGQVAKTQKTA